MNSLIIDVNGWTPFCYALWKEKIPCVLELLKGSDRESLAQLGVIISEVLLSHLFSVHLFFTLIL